MREMVREKRERESMCLSRLTDSNLADCSTAESGRVESGVGAASCHTPKQ